MLRLARATGREDLRRSAERTLEVFAPRMESGGAAIPQMLAAVAYALSKPVEIVLAGPGDAPAMRDMLASIRRRFLPFASVIMASQAPHPMPAIDGRPTAYVSEDFACKLPVTEAGDL